MDSNTQKTIEKEVINNVRNNETKEVRCAHCNKIPGYIKAIGDGDEVYRALECDCKQTPYMRSTSFVDATWNSVTYAQDPDVANKIAADEAPEWIKRVTSVPRVFRN